MNFSSDSVKLEIRPHKEDFYLDVETPRGHVFIVLDFAPHDYVNLTPALKNRLEMIVTSFETTSRFSPDFFLGFVALEINNYLNNLSKQADGTPIQCSAALCLVNGNQFSYFLCGDVLLNTLSGGKLVPLHGAGSGSEPYPEPLGARNSQVTLTNQVKTLTLQDSDTVLIMTQGVGKTVDQARLAREAISLRSSDPKAIRDAILAASAASRNDRTLVVIGGPYTRSGEPTLAELSKAVASMEAKLNALSVAPAADTSPRALRSGEEISEEAAAPAAVIDQPRYNLRSLGLAAALATLVIALVGGIAGSWFQSRTLRKNPEVWSVRTSGNQIEIARLDESGPSAVSLSLDQPAKTTGEQRFSSFSDAKQYMEMIARTSNAPNQSAQANQASASTVVPSTQPSQSNPTDSTVEYSAKSGDSLMSLASRTQVSPDRLKALNPNITRWRSIQVGQKIALPSPSPANQASAQGELVASSSPSPNTTEVSVGRGDSVLKFARRHNVSAEELRRLNPNISRWPMLRLGERITLPPAPHAESSPATPQVTPTASPVSAPVEPAPAPTTPAGTKEVRIGRGESLNSLAQLFNCSPRRIKQLNPRIRNWASIYPGQRILVPALPGS